MGQGLAQPDPQLLTMNAATKWLQRTGFPVTRYQLTLAACRGDLKARNPAPRVWLVCMADLQAYAANLRAREAAAEKSAA